MKVRNTLNTNLALLQAVDGEHDFLLICETYVCSVNRTATG